MTVRFRNKTLAVLLGATFGFIGAHRFYLSGKASVAAWAYVAAFFSLLGVGLGFSLRDPAFGLNMPYDIFSPAMLLIALPTLVAFLDSILLALQPDARFDAHFNTEGGKTNHSGGAVVALAAVSLLVGAGLMTLMLAVDLEAAVQLMPHRALDQAPPP